MPLTDPHRATVREKLRPVIADDEALDDLMSQFPASPSDAPATKTDLTILAADLHTEIRDASIRILTVMITAMIALNGITVGLVAALS